MQVTLAEACCVVHAAGVADYGRRGWREGAIQRGRRAESSQLLCGSGAVGTCTHQKSRNQREQAKEQVRREVLDASAQVNRTLLANVNQDVLRVHDNQKKIEAKTRLLEEQTRRFVAQTSNWAQSYDKLDSALRSLGDVGKWAKGVESELAGVTAALEFVAEHEPTQGR